MLGVTTLSSDSCSTSPPDGNQVDGLPSVIHNTHAIVLCFGGSSGFEAEPDFRPIKFDYVRSGFQIISGNWIFGFLDKNVGFLDVKLDS